MGCPYTDGITLLWSVPSQRCAHECLGLIYGDGALPGGSGGEVTFLLQTPKAPLSAPGSGRGPSAVLGAGIRLGLQVWAGRAG